MYRRLHSHFNDDGDNDGRHKTDDDVTTVYDIESSPEPGPDFNAKQIEAWGIFWPMHYVTFGILFALLFLYVGFNLSRLIFNRKNRFQRFRVYVITNCMLLYFAFIKAFSLLVNPYESGIHFYFRYEGILFMFRTFAMPCLTASFCLVELSLLEVGKLQVYSKRLQNMKLIFSIIAIHFVVTCALTLQAILSGDSETYLMICRICYIIIGILICVSSVHAGVKLCYAVGISEVKIKSHESTRHNEAKVSYTSETEKRKRKPSSSSDIQNGEETTGRLWWKIANISMKNKRLRRLVKVLLATSGVGLVYWTVSIFAMVSSGIDSFHDPNEWQWLIVQSIFRLNEFAMGFALTFITHGCRNQRSFKKHTIKSIALNIIGNKHQVKREYIKKESSDISGNTKKISELTFSSQEMK